MSRIISECFGIDGIFSLFHPRDVILGFVSIVFGLGVLLYSTSKQEDAVQFKKDHPLISLAVIALACYLTIYALSSIVTFLFALALPLLGEFRMSKPYATRGLSCKYSTGIFIHASFRLRSLANKVNSKLEMLGLKKTLMFQFFELVGFDTEATDAWYLRLV